VVWGVGWGDGVGVWKVEREKERERERERERKKYACLCRSSAGGDVGTEMDIGWVGDRSRGYVRVGFWSGFLIVIVTFVRFPPEVLHRRHSDRFG
jgi:hypothetical protein